MPLPRDYIKSDNYLDTHRYGTFIHNTLPVYAGARTLVH